MRRIFPLLLILLLLCGCGGNRDAAAPEDADRLVIFAARSAAVYDDAVREFERRTGIWVEVHTADGALPLLEQITAGQRCDLLLGVGAALHYDNPEDVQSVEMRRLVIKEGVKAALARIASLPDTDPLLPLAAQAYEEVERIIAKIPEAQ